MSRYLTASIPSNVICRLPTLARVRGYGLTRGVGSSTAPSNPTTVPPPWRPSNTLDEWVQREARPTSLRQLTVFGRTLTESRLLSSANYVRLELPTRLAHRLRDMQTLPYSALSNPHISHVYELYYRAFDLFRAVPEVRSLADNERFCDVLNLCLHEHMSVIPRLAIGILEIQSFVPGEDCDRFIATLLRSRISRRVIAEQHLALTNTFHTPRHSANSKKTSPSLHDDDFVGEIFLKCNAREIIDKCARIARDVSALAYGPDVTIPEVDLHGHLDTTFPYIPSHIEYIVGELLRNSIQAIVEERPASDGPPPPIDVLICEAAQHVIIRVSDQGGGVPAELLPHLWSFAKGPRRSTRLRNLGRVPRLAATMQELQRTSTVNESDAQQPPSDPFPSSLSSLSSRPPNLRLGIGLPMSRIYAEYWAGSLELQSLDGYGTDAFLQISRLGNKNEVLSTRSTMDGV